MKVGITEVQQKAKLQTKIGLRKRRCGSCKGKTFEKRAQGLKRVSYLGNAFKKNGSVAKSRDF